MSDAPSSDKRRNALRSLKRKDTIGIILLRDEQVGKTGIVKRWLHDEFHEKYKATVEDFYDKDTRYLGRAVNVVVIDIAGSGQFPAMDELYIKRSDIIILTYEIGNEKSRSSLEWYYKNVRKYIGDKEVTFAVAGTKFDKYEKTGYYDEVSKDTFHDMKTKPVEFLTSAKNDHNIKELFDHVIGLVIGNKASTVERKKEIPKDENFENNEVTNCCAIA